MGIMVFVSPKGYSIEEKEARHFCCRLTRGPSLNTISVLTSQCGSKPVLGGEKDLNKATAKKLCFFSYLYFLYGGK
jgi:hypothetical protein